MKTRKTRPSIMKKMLWALIGGLVVGFGCMFLKENLSANPSLTPIWNTIDAVLFADITADKGFHSLGLFYIVGQLFMSGLQMSIVPLVLVSLTLAICNIKGKNNLGGIAGKTILCFIIFYIIGATISGLIAWTVRGLGWFNVRLPEVTTSTITELDPYNPLTVILNAMPSNLVSALSDNGGILSVVVIAIILGICMYRIPEKTEPLKKVLESINAVIQLFLDFWINQVSPIAIFCMLSRTFATYGTEYLLPVAAFIATTIGTGLLLVFTIYPIGIFATTRLNPIPFIRKIFKVGLFSAMVNSSAATLPLNMKTCEQELGCSDEITSFVLPTGMTINMNGTTVMHMIAVTFIATAAGVDITPATLVTCAFLSICCAMGCPAIPAAGTTLIYVLLTGLGMTSEACMAAYALVLAMNYPAGMAVITMNVVGDAATDVIVCSKENCLDRKTYLSPSSSRASAPEGLTEKTE